MVTSDFGLLETPVTTRDGEDMVTPTVGNSKRAQHPGNGYQGQTSSSSGVVTGISNFSTLSSG